MENHSDRTHAILSPSSMHIALNCNGMVVLKEKYGATAATEASSRGTQVHEWNEKALSNFLQHKTDGCALMDLEKDIGVDAEGVPLVQGWVQNIWENALDSSVTGKAYGIEERFTFHEQFSIWGTADFWAIGIDERAKRYGVIVDYKNGGSYVEEKDNPQLICYAVALRQEIRNAGKDLDYVRAAIYQPNAEGEPYREIKLTAKQLDRWEKKFIKLGEDFFLKQKIKFKYGDHCLKCNYRDRCEVFTKEVSTKTQLQFLDPATFQFPTVEEIPVENLVQIALHDKQISALVKAAKKTVMSLLHNGQTGLGVKLVAGKGKRGWDKEKSEEFIKKAEALGATGLWEPKLIGMGKAKKVLAPFLGKKADVEEFIDQFVTPPSTPVTLAPESDPRPALEGALALFEDESEGEE